MKKFLEYLYYLPHLALIGLFVWASEPTGSGIINRLTPPDITRADSVFLIAALLLSLFVAGGIAARLLSPDRVGRFPAISLILIATLVLAYLVYIDGKDQTAAVLLGIGMAGVGWFFQSQASQALQRKQHTLTVLFEMRQCDHFIEAMASATVALNS